MFIALCHVHHSVLQHQPGPLWTAIGPRGVIGACVRKNVPRTSYYKDTKLFLYLPPYVLKNPPFFLFIFRFRCYCIPMMINRTIRAHRNTETICNRPAFLSTCPLCGSAIKCEFIICNNVAFIIKKRHNCYNQMFFILEP